MKCRECGAEYDVQMPRCPECGFPNEEYRQPQDSRQVSDNAQAVDYFNDTAESKMGKFMNPKVIGAIAGGVVLLCVALFFIFHDGNKGKVKDLCVEFGNAYNANDKAAMTRLYPKLDATDYMSFTINEGDIDVSKKDGAYIAKIGTDKELIVKGENGVFHIDDSRGIYTFDDKDLDLAKKTGQFKATLTDQQNKSRLNDSGFNNWLRHKAESYAKSLISVRLTNGTAYEDINNFLYNIVVNNKTDVDLEMSDYKVIETSKNHFYQEEKANGYSNTQPYYTNDLKLGLVKAGREEVFRNVCGDGNDSSVSSIKLELSMPTEKLFKIYKPTGSEYDEYASSKTSQADISSMGEKAWVESMIPRLKSEKMTEAELSQYSHDQLQLLRNAIFADHGYIFSMKKFKDFFSQYDWYTPKSKNVNSQFNDIEKYNVDLIKSME